jgi:hypothetical protein
MRRQSLIAGLLGLCLLGAACASGADNGGFCTVPVLHRGLVTPIPVEDIEHGICGVALIDGHYVRLEDKAVRKVAGAAVCGSDGACRRTVRYFLHPGDADPYIIEYQSMGKVNRASSASRRTEG